MCTSRVFYVDGAETEKAHEEKLLQCQVVLDFN